MGDGPSQIRQPANRSRLDGSLIEPAHGLILQSLESWVLSLTYRSRTSQPS